MDKEETLKHIEKNLPISPMTLEKVHKEAKERISAITKELHEGFEFLEYYPKSVTFFGSSRLPDTDPMYKKAQSIAKKLSEAGYSTVTGGGPGIMEAANKGSKEGGSPSLGLAIKLPHEQVLNPYTTEHIDFEYFFVRKVCLSFSAEAYLFFPGGFGTLDEFFEILTLVQTHKIKKVPIIMVGDGYWTDLEAFMQKHMLEKGMIDKDDHCLYTITDDEDKILEIIKSSPIQEGVPLNH